MDTHPHLCQRVISCKSGYDRDTESKAGNGYEDEGTTETDIRTYHQSGPQCVHVAVRLTAGSGEMFAGGGCLVLSAFAAASPNAGLNTY